jgi:hypothetical protein
MAGAGAGAGGSAGAGADAAGGVVSPGAMGVLEHAASIPRMSDAHPTHRKRPMTLILLEALGAGLIFVAIVWWTMFSGRKNGELPSSDAKDDEAAPKD